MNFSAYLSYVLLTAGTPGPNNIMAMSNAGRHGFKKGLPFNIGVFFGSFIIMACSAAFASVLFSLIPQIEPFMVYAGAAYILWLAWTIWRDRPHDEKRGMQINSIASGMTLQFVNVKGIMFGITGMSTFVLPHYRGFFAVAPFVLLMASCSFVCTCLWSLFGSAFESFFNSHRKLSNAIMALLLVYCALTQLL